MGTPGSFHPDDGRQRSELQAATVARPSFREGLLQCVSQRQEHRGIARRVASCSSLNGPTSQGSVLSMEPDQAERATGGGQGVVADPR